MIVEEAPETPTGTLRYGIHAEAVSMDPVRASNYYGPLIYPEYDTLLSLDWNQELQPSLATEWSNPDPLTWRFTLRDDVRFHDGSAFDAETVKLNLDRAKTIEASPNSHVYQVVDSVETEGTNVAIVHLNEPMPTFGEQMAYIPGVMISPEAIRSGADLTRYAAGSGGWIWDASAHQEGRLHVFRANPDYWNPDAVKAEVIEVNVMPDDAARMNAAQSRQLDIATITPDQADAITASGLSVISELTTQWDLGILDRTGTLVPELADPRVREAIGLLIDREGFNQSVYQGKASSTIGGFASDLSRWYDPSLESQPPNVERAKELLAEAGVPNGFSMQMPSMPAVRVQLEALAQMLAAGGIVVDTVDVQPQQYYASIRRGEFPAALFPLTAVDQDQWYSSSVSNTGTLNPFKLSDLADLDAQYQASLTSPFDERKPIMDMIQREVMDRGVMYQVTVYPRSTSVAQSVRASDELFFNPDDILPRPYHLWTEAG
jgi:peptide/nickel transport system substrate-binding protein